MQGLAGALERDDARSWLAGVRTAPEPSDPAEWIRWMVEHLDSNRLAEFAAGASATAMTGTTEITDCSFRSDVDAVAHESLQSFLRTLAGGESGEAWVAPPNALRLARVCARRGVDLAVLLKIYRLGQSHFWQRTMTESEVFVADPALRSHVLALMWERLNLWLEKLIEDLSSAYRDECRRWTGGSLLRRAELLSALVAGESVDFERAGLELGYDLRRWHTAALLWLDDTDDLAAADALLEDAAAHLVAMAGTGAHALTNPGGLRTLVALMGTHESPCLQGISAVHGSVRIAIGRSYPGPMGLKRSHDEATTARRIALADVRRPAIVHFDDIEVIALIAQDPQSAQRLVVRELGGLAGSDAASAQLRITALTYLQTGRSATATARRLGTHKNTVSHRLARIEEEIGHPIAERDLQLRLALMVAEAFGPS